jgi:hypothetical protein
MHGSNICRLLLVSVLVLLGTSGLRLREVGACIGCSPTATETQAELYHRSPVVLLGTWLESRRGDKQSPAATTFEVAAIGKDKLQRFRPEQTVELDRFVEANQGKTFLLLGSIEGAGTLRWEAAEPTTQAAFDYLRNAPSPDLPIHKRLPYYLKFLDSSDEYINQDAYNEFALAPFEEVARIKDSIPADKVRQWLADPQTPTTRWGLYGVLLGLAGTPEDAELLYSKFATPSDDFRLGVEGIMTGYLMLVGEQGLDVIKRTKLVNPQAKFSETYAAMQTLRYMWQYLPDRIPAERLKASMRTLLDRPELADIVIADLSRWEDWAVVDKLVALYDHEDYNIPAIKRAIIRYLLTCENSWQEADSGEIPEYIVTARQALARIEQNDPKTVRDAKRFFRLR